MTEETGKRKRRRSAIVELDDELREEIRGLVQKRLRDGEELQAEFFQANLASRDSLSHLATQIKKSLENYQGVVERLLRTFEIIEETMRNVLLAIRQNEYLQAWYPEQQGYPAMKVVGSHPIQAKRKGRQRAQ